MLLDLQIQPNVIKETKSSDKKQSTKYIIWAIHSNIKDINFINRKLHLNIHKSYAQPKKKVYFLKDILSKR